LIKANPHLRNVCSDNQHLFDNSAKTRSANSRACAVVVTRWLTGTGGLPVHMAIHFFALFKRLRLVASLFASRTNCKGELVNGIAQRAMQFASAAETKVANLPDTTQVAQCTCPNLENVRLFCVGKVEKRLVRPFRTHERVLPVEGLEEVEAEEELLGGDAERFVLFRHFEPLTESLLQSSFPGPGQRKRLGGVFDMPRCFIWSLDPSGSSRGILDFSQLTATTAKSSKLHPRIKRFNALSTKRKKRSKSKN